MTPQREVDYRETPPTRHNGATPSLDGMKIATTQRHANNAMEMGER